MPKDVALLIPALILYGLTTATYGGFYRWVDGEGNVYYADSIPPERIKSGHTELREDGMPVGTIPPAKTLEEARKEQELDRLRAEQERLLEAQRDADRSLLRTFRSEEDIEMARDGKITAIDVIIDVRKIHIHRQQEKLVRLRGQAADRERAGQSIPHQLSEQIAQTEQAIGNDYSVILDKEDYKRLVRTSFNKDLERFRQLKNIPTPDSETQAHNTRPILHNIVPCADTKECDRLWEKATKYVRQNAGTAVQTSSETLFITAPPTNAQDVSLILSRIQDKEGTGASLFLDLQCERSVHGRKVCESQPAQSIIEGFRPAIFGAESPPP